MEFEEYEFSGVMYLPEGTKVVVRKVPFDPVIKKEKVDRWECYFCNKRAGVWTMPKVVPVCKEHLAREEEFRRWIIEHNKEEPLESQEEWEYVRELREP